MQLRNYTILFFICLYEVLYTTVLRDCSIGLAANVRNAEHPPYYVTYSYILSQPFEQYISTHPWCGGVQSI